MAEVRFAPLLGQLADAHGSFLLDHIDSLPRRKARGKPFPLSSFRDQGLQLRIGKPKIAETPAPGVADRGHLAQADQIRQYMRLSPLPALPVPMLVFPVLAADQPQPASGPTRPVAGFTLYHAAPDLEISDGTDLGDGTIVPAIRLIGPRNGVVSGQVVARDAGPIRGLRATAGELKQQGGPGLIPQSALRIRYGIKEGIVHHGRGGKGCTYYDYLFDVVPAEAASCTLPIWITVADWRAPAPRDFISHIGLVQSPETVAIKYNVPLWSDGHFALMGKSFQLMGEVGNKVVSVSAITQTQLGNYQSMIRLLRSGDGKLAVDFSVMERYLDVYEQQAGKPAVCYVYAWDVACERARDQRFLTCGVTVVDKATGEVSEKEFAWASPECEAYFKEVMEGVRARILRRGCKEDVLMIGTASDSWPSEKTVEMFRRVAPKARWVVNSHNFAASIHGTEVGYIAWVRSGQKKEGRGWRNPMQETSWPRSKGDWRPNPTRWRYFVEEKLTWGYRGIGKIGGDFWAVPLPDALEPQEMDNRLRSRWTGNLALGVVTSALLAPGPDGAAATARFEMFREGIQEAEARIFIEQALGDEKLRAKLGDDLAQRATKVLADRPAILYNRRDGGVPGLPWQQLAEKLFAVASEVERQIR